MSLNGEQRQAREALERGDIDAALAIYQQALERHADDLNLTAEFGCLLWRTYEFERGRAVFARLLDDPRTEVPTIRMIAKRFFEIGRFKAAASAMKIAVDRSPPADCETVELYASVLERDNQLDPAREQALHALALNPASSKAVRLLAHLDQRDGAYERAVDRLQSHLDTFASDSNWGLRYELAASLDRLERYEEAWEQLTLAKDPLRGQAQTQLRNSYPIRQRQWDLAGRITDADLFRWHGEFDGRLGPRRRLALLAGFPRSGTTLLEQMIASHTDCIGTDETGILASQFTASMIWQAASVSDAILELRSLNREQIVAGRDAYLRMTQAFLDEAIGDRMLIEKDPLLTSDLAVPLRLFPEASLLMPLRDPRDVIVSYCFTMVPLNWNSAPAINPIEASRFYADCMRHWLLFRNRLPWACHEVRYEHLVASPEEALQQVAAFLGLNWEPAMLDSRCRSERRAVRTPTYVDITRPISARAVGRWVHYQKFLEPALPWLRPFLTELGYE